MRKIVTRLVGDQVLNDCNLSEILAVCDNKMAGLEGSLIRLMEKVRAVDLSGRKSTSGKGNGHNKLCFECANDKYTYTQRV